MLEHFSPPALKTVMYAQEEARRAGNPLVTPEHLLLGLLRDTENIAVELLESKRVDFRQVRAALQSDPIGRRNAVMEIHFSEEVRKIFELAEEEASLQGEAQVEPDHLLLGLAQLSEGKSLQALETAGLHLAHLRWNVLRLRYHKRNLNIRTASLDRYSQDLTRQLEAGELPMVTEWQPMVERLIQLIGMNRKHHVLMVGEHGTGKTSLIHALNQHILDSRIFYSFAHCRVLCLQVDKMLAEAGSHEKLYELVQALVGEIRQSGDVILVIENIHRLFLANKKEMEFVITQHLLTVLEETHTTCIATTTPAQLKHLEAQTPIQYLFQMLEVPEPPREFCQRVLQQWKSRLETHHRLSITPEAIQMAVRLAQDNSGRQFLPESALTLLDLSCARKIWRQTQALQSARKAERRLRQLLEQRALMAPEIEESPAVRKAFEHIKQEILDTELLLQEQKSQFHLEGPVLSGQDIILNLDRPWEAAQ
jgi:ATP-dependent Clp protease ATP-binding subunit ClpC